MKIRSIIRKSVIYSFAVCAALFIGVTGASAQTMEQHHKMPPSINTTAEATVTARPDRARIDVGVTTRADTSEAAVGQNAQKLDATLERLRGLLGGNANITTVSYTLQPNYRYPREGGEPELTGYTASNIVRVIVDDLTKVGTVIDTATEAGANRVQSLQFMLKDDRAIKAQALREAALDARQKADALADALNLKIVRILNVTESGQAMIPIRDVAYARAETASTPIEPGIIEIKATVSLTVEVQ
jgi:hypothetical protein